MTPGDVLVAATRGDARLMGKEEELGDVAPDMRADLLVLAADPRADIANLQRLEHVVLRGRARRARARQGAPDAALRGAVRVGAGAAHRDVVVDHERVTGIPGRGVVRAVAVYRVVDGKIASVWMVP